MLPKMSWGRARVHNPEPDSPPQAIIRQLHSHPVSGVGPGCSLRPFLDCRRLPGHFEGGGVGTAGGVTIPRLALPGTAKTG
jgi:hypothetical protein